MNLFSSEKNARYPAVIRPLEPILIYRSIASYQGVKMKTNRSDHVIFTKEFTKQESIPEEGIQRAVELMQSGRLHRYNTAPNEIGEVALLEKEYAAYVNAKY